MKRAFPLYLVLGLAACALEGEESFDRSAQDWELPAEALDEVLEFQSPQPNVDDAPHGTVEVVGGAFPHLLEAVHGQAEPSEDPSASFPLENMLLYVDMIEVSQDGESWWPVYIGPPVPVGQFDQGESLDVDEQTVPAGTYAFIYIRLRDADFTRTWCPTAHHPGLAGAEQWSAIGATPAGAALLGQNFFEPADNPPNPGPLALRPTDDPFFSVLSEPIVVEEDETTQVELSLLPYRNYQETEDCAAIYSNLTWVVGERQPTADLLADVLD